MAGLTPLGGLATAVLSPLQNLTLGNVASTIVNSAAGSLVGSVAKAATVDRITQGKERDLRIRQLQEKQRLEQARLSEKTVLEKQELQLASAEAERKRRQALKRAVARSEASFAGRGLSNTSGGSADAILLGLFDESEQERSEREILDRIRTTALDQNLDYQANRNLLETSQMREQNRLQNQLF